MTPITASTTLTAQSTVGYLDNDTNAGAGCGYFNMPGLDRAYLVTLPAGQRLTATATPVTGYDVGVDFVLAPASSCDVDPRVCLAGTDNNNAGIAETASYSNSSGSAQSIYVIVDSFSSGASGTFDLNLVIDTPPSVGDVCSAPTPITMSGTLAGQSTAGFSNNYAPDSNNATCTGDDNTGLDRVYSVTLTAGQVLTVTATPTATGDLGVYLIAGPAANCTTNPTCLNGMDVGFDGVAETATYTNATGALLTVFIVVDSFYPNTPFSYSLNVSIM